MEQKVNGESEAGGSPKLNLTQDQIDTIGEILNISMGSAATAMSSLLDKQVIITPPTVTQKVMNSLDYAELEPAILVKIQYIEGLKGNNIMLFRQHDMQIILNLLMGTDDLPRDDFEFDELSMSAACEVMNQMMGASATALAEVLGKPVNISTPDAYVITDQPIEQYVNIGEDEEIISVSFGLVIKDIINTSFASIMPCEFAETIIAQVLGDQEQALNAIVPPPVAFSPVPAPARAAPPMQQPMPPAQQPMPPAQQPMPPGYPPGGYPPGGYPPGGYPQYGQYPAYPPPQPGMYAEGGGVIRQPINVKAAQFPDFSSQQGSPVGGASTSMNLLMGVPLCVTVEIGKTRRKIKDIMEFGQGTVIELEKQAGAPVDIMVNGQMIARGDVVVIEDNFGVRITEILGTKDLLDTLNDV